MAKTSANGKKADSSATKRAANADFAGTFDALKKVMAAVAPELHVIADEPKKYYLVTKSKSWKGGPMHFGAVIMGKAYVSYHLMPLYMHGQLCRTISGDLKKRMQGKTCFNFKALNPVLYAELGELTKAGLEAYRAKNWL